jgi:YD repeat-containing protein
MGAPPEYPRIEYPDTFIIELEDCIPHFAPESNAEEDKTYILSLWVYQAFDNADPIYSYEGDVTIDVLIGSTPASISPDVVFGSLIDGWQKVDVVFTIVDGSTGNFQLKILNESSTDIIYVDDVRIMPFDARANCYVYDYKSYRLLSELDASHFSTFYDYDEEGRLTRVRKETENGIMTISENRYSTVKREF